MSLDREIASYRIVGPGDVLCHRLGSPELTTPAGQYRSLKRYRQLGSAGLGTMFYPHIGKVSVVGKLCQRFAAMVITGRLAKYIADPQGGCQYRRFPLAKAYISGREINPVSIITNVPLTVPMRLTPGRPDRYGGLAQRRVDAQR